MEGVVLVTGGVGFIGSALLHRLLDEGRRVVNLDCLTYAANPATLAELEGRAGHVFERVDVRDAAAVRGVFARHRPAAVLHLAAESHVDRSIDGPADFVRTNVVGTLNVLRASVETGVGRFLHVSTDEVYGSIATGAADEDTPYDPRSPYAASKAAADHLVRAFGHTYGLPVLLTHCTNNYGPRQHPEKLIPHMIAAGLRGAPLPVYGDGGNVRDWLHVEDHVSALLAVLERGEVGGTYHVSAGAGRTNLDVVRAICAHLGGDAGQRITFVRDRPGHDRRYALAGRRIRAELGWVPRHDFTEGLRDTVDWYLGHRGWWADFELRRRGLG